MSHRGRCHSRRQSPPRLASMSREHFPAHPEADRGLADADRPTSSTRGSTCAGGDPQGETSSSVRSGTVRRRLRSASRGWDFTVPTAIPSVPAPRAHRLDQRLLEQVLTPGGHGVPPQTTGRSPPASPAPPREPTTTPRCSRSAIQAASWWTNPRTAQTGDGDRGQCPGPPPLPEDGPKPGGSSRATTSNIARIDAAMSPASTSSRELPRRP
jgi:hypothetical protein